MGKLRITRTGAQNQGATIECRFQVFMYDRLLQKIICTGRHRRRFRAGESLRIHQVKMLQTHHFHGPCCRTDVARMGGIDQYYANM